VARPAAYRAAASSAEIQQLGYVAKVGQELDIDSDDDDWAGPALRDLGPREPTGSSSRDLEAGRILAIMATRRAARSRRSAV